MASSLASPGRGLVQLAWPQPGLPQKGAGKPDELAPAAHFDVLG